jgi:hypothetical protein
VLQLKHASLLEQIQQLTDEVDAAYNSSKSTKSKKAIPALVQGKTGTAYNNTPYHKYFVVCTAKLAIAAAHHFTFQVNDSSSNFNHTAARL